MKSTGRPTERQTERFRGRRTHQVEPINLEEIIVSTVALMFLVRSTALIRLVRRIS